jgi:transposase
MFLKFSQNNAASAPGMAYLARHNASYICVIPGGGMARRRDDAKEAALREARCLNPRPEAVADQAFTAGPEFFDARDLVQVKYEMVRRVRADGESVTAAAAAFGFSRPSYYQAAAAVDAGGLAGLVPARPGPRRAHKLTAEVVAFARQLRNADPSLRSADLAAAIAGRFGITVHPRSVERALARAAAPKSAADHGEQR